MGEAHLNAISFLHSASCTFNFLTFWDVKLIFPDNIVGYGEVPTYVWRRYEKA